MTIIEVAQELQKDGTKRFIREDGKAVFSVNSFGGLDLRSPDDWSYLPICTGDMLLNWEEVK